MRPLCHFAALLLLFGFAFPPRTVGQKPTTVPAGTEITVRLIDGIDSQKTGAGERFRASIDDPVIVGDTLVLPRNADATVQIVKAEKSSELAVKLYDVTVNGKQIDTVS